MKKLMTMTVMLMLVSGELLAQTTWFGNLGYGSTDATSLWNLSGIGTLATNAANTVYSNNPAGYLTTVPMTATNQFILTNGNGSGLINLQGSQVSGAVANATTATSATNDSAGNNISLFYYPTSNPSAFISTVPSALNNLTVTNLTVSSNLTLSGTLSVSNINATSISGGGSGLTNLPWMPAFRCSSGSSGAAIWSNTNSFIYYGPSTSGAPGNGGDLLATPLAPGWYGMARGYMKTGNNAMAVGTNITATFCTNVWGNSTPVSTGVTLMFSNSASASVYVFFCAPTNFANTFYIPAEGSYGIWQVTNNATGSYVNFFNISLDNHK